MIYRCVPRNVKRVWGSLPGGIGEVWWVYDDPEGSSALEPLSGGGRTELAGIWPDSRFPLLVKTLHTSADLSVQVHPGLGGLFPRKDETWVVLSGHGTIRAGILPGVSRSDFEQAIESGNPALALKAFEASPGMTLHLPAGTVHSLGAGMSVLEVQLNCDITYRLWDWGRKGLDGSPRPLHVRQGLDSVDWERGGRPVLPSGSSIDGGDYTLESSEGPVLLGPWEILFMPGKPACLVADGAGGRLHAAPGSWKVVMKG